MLEDVYAVDHTLDGVGHVRVLPTLLHGGPRAGDGEGRVLPALLHWSLKFLSTRRCDLLYNSQTILM